MDITEIEKAEGFDREAVLALVQGHMTRTVGQEVETYASDVPGVLAFERTTNGGDFDWKDVVALIEREQGVTVACVANCDWQVEGSNDEEATYLAVAIPSLPADYDTPFRLQYKRPTAAPTP